MKEYIQVVRYDDEGFKLHNKIHDIGEKFFDIKVKSINKILKIPHEKYEKSQNKKVKGCFAFLYKYNINEVKKGNLLHRKNDRKNYMFIPIDEYVYARNVNWDNKKRLVEKSEEKFNFIRMKHNFILMKGNVFIERIDINCTKEKYIDEKISEIFITKNQINKYKTSFLGKIKFHLLNKLGLIKIYK